MKFNFNEMRDMLKETEEESGWIVIPSRDYIEDGVEFDDFYEFVRYSFDNGSLHLEYSENGVDFNLYSDWRVAVDAKGHIKGKGSTRHRDAIEGCLKWFVKAVYDSRYREMFKYSPSFQLKC